MGGDFPGGVFEGRIFLEPLICNEYFHMTKIICANNVQTQCNIKLNLGHRSQS